MPPKLVDVQTSPFTSRRSSRGSTPINRGTSPIPFKKFDKVIGNLNNGEYMTAHQLPAADRPIYQRNHLRRALLGGLLGLGSYLAYQFREPLVKLGHAAYNYGMDKFHNLSFFKQPANSTALIPGLHHN